MGLMNNSKNKLNSEIILIFNSNPNAHYMQKKEKTKVYFLSNLHLVIARSRIN